MPAGHIRQDLQPAPPADTGTQARATRGGQCVLDSDRLLQGEREVLIRHGGECYRLRHTRNDKLILTK